jgi:hypothetical protein
MCGDDARDFLFDNKFLIILSHAAFKTSKISFIKKGGSGVVLYMTHEVDGLPAIQIARARFFSE